jgi:hypothetical protein
VQQLSLDEPHWLVPEPLAWQLGGVTHVPATQDWLEVQAVPFCQEPLLQA